MRIQRGCRVVPNLSPKPVPGSKHAFRGIPGKPGFKVIQTVFDVQQSTEREGFEPS